MKTKDQIKEMRTLSKDKLMQRISKLNVRLRNLPEKNVHAKNTWRRERARLLTVKHEIEIINGQK